MDYSGRILTLIQIDVNNLFDKIIKREKEYLTIFSIKRTREPFEYIFKNRYEDVPISDLKECSEELLVALDHFYRIIDDMRWYLFFTEDMPNTVEDRVYTFNRELVKKYDQIQLYLSAEIDISKEAC
jgi:hypothetical protein